MGHTNEEDCVGWFAGLTEEHHGGGSRLQPWRRTLVPGSKGFTHQHSPGMDTKVPLCASKVFCGFLDRCSGNCHHTGLSVVKWPHLIPCRMGTFENRGHVLFAALS